MKKTLIRLVSFLLRDDASRAWRLSYRWRLILMAVNLVQTRDVESVVELGINLDINDRACLIIMSRLTKFLWIGHFYHFGSFDPSDWSVYLSITVFFLCKVLCTVSWKFLERTRKIWEMYWKYEFETVLRCIGSPQRNKEWNCSE